MGDFNGRIGESMDFNDSIDSIPNRIPLDKVRNQQGDSLIDFLKDTRMCIVNGRGEPTMDNFTSVSPRGQAVVDYIITPYDCLRNVSDFKVSLVQDCLKRFKIIPNTAKIPDHSILSCLLNFFNIDLSGTISAKNLVDMVKRRLMNIRERQWTESVLQSAKLRTYRIFKSSIGKEDYLDRFLSIQQRSALARFRCGSFPLAVELGRYRRPVIPLEQRTCRLCNSGHIENEEHFLIQCSEYNDIRSNLFGPLNINDVTDEFKRIMKHSDPKIISNYIISAYERRNVKLANTWWATMCIIYWLFLIL